MPDKIYWDQFLPETVMDIGLPHPFIQGPMNSMGEECPWPWEPQQLVSVPLGQYHCEYCGDMVIAGVHHPDWANFVISSCATCGNGPLDSDEEILGVCRPCRGLPQARIIEDW